MDRESPPDPAPTVSHSTERDTLATLDRAIMILEAVSQAGGGSLEEIAVGLQQTDGFAARVLRTLEAREIVAWDAQSKIWHVGPGAFRIGSAFLQHANLLEWSVPTIGEVLETTGETTSVSIKCGNTSICVAQEESPEALRVSVPTGSRSSMHASATGKALLAFSDDETVEMALRGPIARYTPNTMADPDALKRDLEETRARGYAIEIDERNEGIRGVAAPVFGPQTKPLAALAISGPSIRLTDARLVELGEIVCLAAQKLSERMGER